MDKKECSHFIKIKKGELLYYEGDNSKIVYLVNKGAIGRVTQDNLSGKRQIMTVALNGMALMTTNHLYSDTPSKGN